jgi:hypothetical protein
MTEPVRYFKPGVPLRPNRVPLQVPVRYHVIGDTWHEGLTENISRTGALIRAAQAPPLGAEVDIILTVPAGILSELSGEVICAGGIARLTPAAADGRPGFAVMFRKCRPTVGSRSL